MKVRTQWISFVCLLIWSNITEAQAISQGALLNQQSIQNAGNSGIQTIPAGTSGSSHATVTEAPPAANSAGVPGNSVDPGRSRAPYLSEYPGYVTPGTQLVISNPNPAASIYFTTDGWTPTLDSPLYEVPFVIRNDVRIQAFAVEPGMLPSPIVDATFIVKPQQPPISKTLSIDDGILHRGTMLRLITGMDARSDSAQVGDPILLKLDENVKVGDKIVAAKGALGKATLTRVERAARGGKPGLIALKVESLEVNGTSIPLSATLTLAAPDLAAQAVKLSNPGTVRISGTLPKGDEAVIEVGMPLNAAVSADTPLH